MPLDKDFSELCELSTQPSLTCPLIAVPEFNTVLTSRRVIDSNVYTGALSGKRCSFVPLRGFSSLQSHFVRLPPASRDQGLLTSSVLFSPQGLRSVFFARPEQNEMWNNTSNTTKPGDRVFLCEEPDFQLVSAALLTMEINSRGSVSVVLSHERAMQ